MYFRFNGAYKPNQFIIILGHIRAGSSLLTKLLCNNPRILGYGETHLCFGSYTDMEAVSGKILFVLRKWISKSKAEMDDVEFFLDKLPHNYLIPEDRLDFLLNDNIRIIFLIRDPEESLSSIMRLLNWDGLSGLLAK